MMPQGSLVSMARLDFHDWGFLKFCASAVTDAATHELIIIIVNASGKQQAGNVSLEGISTSSSKGMVTVLQSSDGLYTMNSFDEPKKISPQQQGISVNDKKINVGLPAYSFSVIRIKI